MPKLLQVGRRLLVTKAESELLMGARAIPCAQVLLHRLTRHATGTGNRALRHAQLPATNDFDDLHATQLPITHPVTSWWRTW
jgi:hypothetical protein